MFSELNGLCGFLEINVGDVILPDFNESDEVHEYNEPSKSEDFSKSSVQ